MGRSYAEGIAATSIPLEEQIRIHLRANHYPPVPESMVPVCLAALNAAACDEWEKLIPLPEGISYRGLNSAPASAIVEQHHLELWLDNEEEY